MAAMRHLMRILPALATCVALVGCTFDAPPRARTEDACVIGGCAGELCADESLVSPCIWHDAYVCYRDALCARQADGACGWTPSDELTACLASHAARN
jgi:hypothetical protein